MHWLPRARVTLPPLVLRSRRPRRRGTRVRPRLLPCRSAAAPSPRDRRRSSRRRHGAASSSRWRARSRAAPRDTRTGRIRSRARDRTRSRVRTRRPALGPAPARRRSWAGGASARRFARNAAPPGDSARGCGPRTRAARSSPCRRRSRDPRRAPPRRGRSRRDRLARARRAGRRSSRYRSRSACRGDSASPSARRPPPLRLPARSPLHLDFHPEQRRRKDFPLRVGLERDRAAAVQRAVKQEVERVKIGQLEALDRPLDHASKMPRDPRRRHLLHEQRIVLGLIGDQSDVGGVALVPGARMREIDEPLFHTSSTSTAGRTMALSSSAGQYATISSGFGRPPANPVTLGGPFRINGAISRVNRSTGASSRARTPTRSWPSGIAATSTSSSASCPWVAVAPTNSVWIASNSSPRFFRGARSTRSAACALANASGQAYTSVPTALYPYKYATETLSLSVAGFPLTPDTRTL